VGYKNSISQPAWLNIAGSWQYRRHVASLLYLALLRLLTLSHLTTAPTMPHRSRSRPSPRARVLRRQVKRPVYRSRDGRCSLQQAGSCLGNAGARSSFVPRRCCDGTAHSSREVDEAASLPGRPAIDPEVRRLIFRWPGRTPVGLLRITTGDARIEA